MQIDNKINYPPQRSWKGVYWIHVRLSAVCGQNRVRYVISTIFAGSISYLHILLNNLRKCVACKVVSGVFFPNFEFLAIL